MSRETFQMIRNTNISNPEIQLALQCAPLLTGLKISNLFSVNNDSARYTEGLFKGSGILCFILRVTDERTTFLLYRPDKLSEYLRTEEVRRLLDMLGYLDSNLKRVLSVFRKRYEGFMGSGLPFPHELGLLLGYPVEDVNGFIVNRGKNFLYAGYWKVYENLPEKLNLFENFNKAKDVVTRFVLCGGSILEILKACNEKKLQIAAI